MTPLRLWPLLLALPASLHAAALPAPIAALEQQGYEILGSFPGPAGMTGYAALYLGRPQTLYLTPDGRQAIVGAMTDARGEKWNPAVVDKQFGDAIWQQLAASAWVGDGDAAAPRVAYVFTDANCGYCRQFWQAARPWVAAGKAQLRHVLVAVIAPDSRGKAAALLADPDPAAALQRHEAAPPQAGVRPLAVVPPAVDKQLAGNQQLMERLGVFATPAIYYRDDQGVLQKAQGMPSAAALARILGER
ncbi:thiol:disulfide interchange protein DsbG [Xenophilus sp. AP218F]|nr:thiol:disulfide interchange protein DsbG [Chromobacterium sp. ASV5]OWY40974.1 thiol:disulfide interchange protein DsbG [Xenophilus sp. AP218F]